MAWAVSDLELRLLVDRMTAEEKVNLLSGRGLWRTAANYRLNIPEILMTDGTYGVRYSIEQIDGSDDGASSLEQFLSIVNQRANSRVETAFGSTSPATCFPNGSCFGCAWDRDLAYELGTALAAECQALGVNLLLGPGINIRRTPLAGRAYEYYGEDPVLTGDLAAGVIRGLQEHGVGASLKHFACNNSEVQRTTMSSEVDSRALREIYLAGFERAIRAGDPWTVMSSYNRLNGAQTAESHWLLTQVLREEWGYQGVVISDWHGIKDRPASLRAGNDLDMPESRARKQALLGAIAEREIDPALLDRACLRVLTLIRRARGGEQRSATVDLAAHHAIARRMAAESIVLLRNEGAALPLPRGGLERILVIGQGARQPAIQGSGCATTRPAFVDEPLAEIMARAGAGTAVVHHAEADAAALAAAGTADAVIVFATVEDGYDGEGSDRTHLHLAAEQDAAIARFAAAGRRVIVVLTTPDVVEMPWIDQVAGVLAAFFAGQGFGAAIAAILFGEQTPCGKLSVTAPRRLEDTPAFLHYPGENGRHPYAEGLYVGYRYYDRRRMEPLFPFGFGLSYTHFAYGDLRLDRTHIADGDRLTVSLDVTNTGPFAGKEIVQIYARPVSPRLHRPLRELKGFAKVALAPGETRRVSIAIPARDFRYFDPARGGWLLDEGELVLEAAASSRDIRLTASVACAAPGGAKAPLSLDSQTLLFIADPVARDRLLAFFRRRLAVTAEGAEQVLAYCGSSFLGLQNTISWFSGEEITREEVAAVVAEINAINGAIPL
jgi:beta-glucosidase